MVRVNTYRYDPDYAVSPGEILEETLEARRMKKADLAERCGLSPKTVSQIISGKAPVSPETAIHLERVLGVSANIWNNLEANYRLFEAKKESKRGVMKEVKVTIEIGEAVLKLPPILASKKLNEECTKLAAEIMITRPTVEFICHELGIETEKEKLARG